MNFITAKTILSLSFQCQRFSESDKEKYRLLHAPGMRSLVLHEPVTDSQEKPSFGTGNNIYKF